MAKAKCPKKQKQQSNMNISAPMVGPSATGTKVIFEHNVQIWNKTYKKGQVEVFDKTDWFERFISVVK